MQSRIPKNPGVMTMVGLLALAALSMACNPLENPTFETGALAPWVPSAENVAHIVEGPEAYGGNYYL